MKTRGIPALLLTVAFASCASAFDVSSRQRVNRVPTVTPTLRQHLLDHTPRLHQSPVPTKQLTSPTALDSSASSSRRNAQAVDEVVDVGAIAKYASALALQLGLFAAAFTALDKGVAALGVEVPFAANCILFYAVALKSRALNPLSNQRPNQGTKEVSDSAQQRNMPTWTPPGVVFPIVWLLLIGPLRAATSAMIFEASGGVYCNEAFFALLLHLCIGDVWNTINNVERRYGTSVVGVSAVYLSAANAAYQYYQVSPVAGELLALKMVWLTIASSLIVRTWQLNPNPETGKLESLLPTKMEGEESKTQFMWFTQEQK